jgi:hypothetical protein
VLPLFDNLYQGIKLLVGRVVEDRPMKYFRMIADRPSGFVPASRQIPWHKNWYLIDLSFQLIKGLLLILPPLETLTIYCYVVIVWSAAKTVEKETMNFLKYCAASLKLLSSMQFVGTGHFMMASILARSILSLPPPITYPRYTKDY